MNSVLKILTASNTKCMFSAKCNFSCIIIQWFHFNRYSGIPYTKIQPYTSRVQKMCFCMILDLGSPTTYQICRPACEVSASTAKSEIQKTRQDKMANSAKETALQ